MLTKRGIPLDLNESYWLVTDEMLRTCTELHVSDLGTYPSYTELISAIAEYAGVSEYSILLLPGSDAGIDALFRLCKSKGLRPLVPLPSFSMYEILSSRYAIDCTRLYYRESEYGFDFPTEECIGALKKGDIGALFLSQPNNPLGCRISPPDLADIIAAAQAAGTIVIIDEAYAEYDSDAQGPIEGVVILRTLSKSFGLSGLRVGYCIAAPSLLAELSMFQLPWPIPGPSVSIALKALSIKGEFAVRRQLLIEEREVFSQALEELNDVHVFPSCGNFVLARVPGADSVLEILASRGIRVALGESKTLDAAAKALLRSTLRMSVPSPSDRPTVLQALREGLDK